MGSVGVRGGSGEKAEPLPLLRPGVQGTQSPRGPGRSPAAAACQPTETDGRVGKNNPYVSNPRNGNTARRVARTA